MWQDQEANSDIAISFEEAAAAHLIWYSPAHTKPQNLCPGLQEALRQMASHLTLY